MMNVAALDEVPIHEVNLAVSVYERVRGMVLSGAIAGGQVIQERRLAEQLGVSRTPLREALGRLEGEGMLRRDGRLLFSTSVAVADVLEILAVRRLLEAEAARSAALLMPQARVEAIRAGIVGMAGPDMVTDDEHWAHDDLLHFGIAGACGNTLLLRLIRDLRQRTRLFGLRRIPARFEAGKAEHLLILDAVAARRPDEAASLMEQHIDRAREAILQALAGPAHPLPPRT